MAVTTVTAPVDTVAPVETFDAVASLDAFRAAIATVDAGDARGVAGATLRALTLSFFRHYGEELARDVRGESIIPANRRKELARRMWVAAGHGDIVKTADRTPGQRTFANYVSQLTGVASNVDYGMTWLSSVETVSAAAEAIRDGKKLDAEELARQELNRELIAMLAWREKLPQSARDTLDAFEKLMLANSVNAGQLHAFGHQLTLSACGKFGDK